MKNTTVYLFTGLTFLLGLVLVLTPEYLPNNLSILKVILSNIGVGLIATSLISIFLQISWSKYRIKIEQQQIKPFIEEGKRFTASLSQLENRLKALKLFGLSNFHKNRDDALKRFYKFASLKLEHSQNSINCVKHIGTINIVSSSARGLMGYLDREPSDIQNEWRELITEYSNHFKFLLTHPAFAHLRQPAEERESGDIELEILKTCIYLHCICGMTSNNLRFYRGSPTVFQIQIDNHILFNPYPYGKMALDSLSLEFESDKITQSDSIIEEFAKKHFNHTWAFYQQPSKKVENNALVEGIDKFDDILKAFSECTFINRPDKLRLSEPQIEELDYFTTVLLRNKFKDNKEAMDRLPNDNKPFENYYKNTKKLISSSENNK